MKKIIFLFAIFMAADGMIELSLHKGRDELQTVKDMFTMFDEMFVPLKFEGQVSSEEVEEEGTSTTKEKGTEEEGEEIEEVEGGKGEEEGQEQGNEDQTIGEQSDAGPSPGEPKRIPSSIQKQNKRLAHIDRELRSLFTQMNERLDAGNLSTAELTILLNYKFLFLSHSINIIRGLYLYHKNYVFQVKHKMAYVALYFLEASARFPLDKTISALKRTLKDRDGYVVVPRMDELQKKFKDLEESIHVKNGKQKNWLLGLDKQARLNKAPKPNIDDKAYTYLKKFFAMLLFKDLIFIPPQETSIWLLDNISSILEARADKRKTQISALVQKVETEIRKSLKIVTTINYDEVSNEMLHLRRQRTVEVFEYHDEETNETTPQLYIMDWTNINYNENDDEMHL